MKIQTKPFGMTEIDERQCLEFPHGIFGFEHHTQWALLDSSQPPFYWLQSLKDPELAFVLMSPYSFRPDYELEIDHDDESLLMLEQQDDLLVMVIVTIPDDHTLMTANLQGPVLINKKNRIGKQTIQTDHRWKVRHRVLEEFSAIGVR